MHTLQNRWLIEQDKLVYYGMRNLPQTLNNTLKLSKKVLRCVKALPKTLTEEDIRVLKPLMDTGVIVEKNHLRITPKSMEEAIFCKDCAANDFMIPGLEFNNDGLCPMCQSSDVTRTFKSVLPVKNHFESTEKSRFDIALFYTGGKDSSYLLYYLSKKLGLKVLALTWEIPFMSESAKKSIEAAKKHLPTVEFISRRMNDADLKVFYHRLYTLSGNTCACPSLAYILFYPDLVHERVPYFVAGNEPVQMLNLYFNRFAPKLAFSETTHRLLLVMTNIVRILTFRRPLKKGQVQTLMTMKQLAFGDPLIKKWSSYDHEILKNILTALEDIKPILKPLRRAVRYSSRTGRVPAFVHIDFNDIEGGHYDWQKVKERITQEIGWVGPESVDKGLHTSCQIEKCKDHTQFLRFYHMESTMIPFSAIEMSLASRAAQLTKEAAIEEIKMHLGFSLKAIPDCKIMRDYLEH